MPGDGHDAERPARHPEGDDRRVDVVVLGKDLEPADRARRIDLVDLRAEEPADDVEVVDREVTEQPARLGDVALMRRGRVVAGQPEGVDRAQRTRLDEPARLPVAGIEATLEPELERQAAGLDLGRDRDRVGEVLGQRLLAEDRPPAGDRRPDERRVGAGRRRDDHGVGPLDGGLRGLGERPADLAGDGPGRVTHGIGDEQLVDARGGAEDPGVHPADPTGPDEGDLHPRLPIAWARTARPIAALSEGGRQVVSCSTISQPS